MPIGGETVGRAYVRIIGDGSSLPEDIKKDLRDPKVKESYTAAGDEHSKAYNEAFLKRQKENSNKTKAALAESLDIGSGRIDATAKNISRGMFTSLRRELQKRFSGTDGVLADQIWQNVLGDYKRGAPLDAIKRSLNEDLPKSIERATKQIEALEEEYRKDREAAYAEHNRRFEAETKDLFDETIKMQRAAAAESLAIERERQDALSLELRDAYRENAEFDRKRAFAQKRDADHLRTIISLTNTLRGQVANLEKGERTLLGTRRQTLVYIAQLRNLATSLPGGDRLSTEIDLISRRVAAAQPHLVAFNRNLDGIATRLGRATGRGSRNDFLHVIGGITEGITRLLLIGPKFISGFISKIDLAFTTAAQGGGAGFVALIQSLGGAASTGIVGLLGLAAAAGLLVFAMGPLVALMSGLLGILTALASTISFALLGGIVALAGAMVPLVAGVSVAVLGLTNMSDTLKNRLGREIKPVTNAFKELGEVAAETLTQNVGEQARIAARILERFKPAVRGISEAIVDIGDSWLRSAEGPGFQRFVNTVERAVPTMLRKLGRIVDNVAGAIGGMFVGATPFLQDFLDWLERITEEWSNWANSAEGTREFREFLEKAADSAESLGGFLESVLGLVSELLDKGNESGNNIFDDMADAIDRLTTHLEENPDALDDWFDNAERLAGEIGGLVTSLGSFFDTLDNEENRKAVEDFIGLIEDLVYAFELLQTILAPLLAPLLNILGVIRYLSEEDIDWSRTLGLDALSGLGESVFNDITRPFESAFNAIRGLFNGDTIDWGSLLDGLRGINGRILDFFRGIGPAIGRVIGRIPWGNLLQGAARLPGQVVGFFGGLAGRVLARIGDIPWSRLGRGMQGLINNVLGYFRGLAADIIGRILPVPWSQLGEGLRDFVNSIPDFFGGVAQAILDAIGSIDLGSLIPDPGGGVPWVPGIASGGMFNVDKLASGHVTRGPQFAIIGEDGPEAVVPLRRPLDQVDPSVRFLSAIAQGLDGMAQGMASGGVRGGRTIDASGWTIVSPQSDSRAVAAEMLNYLVATSYTA